MEPNQAVGNAPTPAPASTPASTPVSAPEENMMAQGVSEKKKGKGAIYGMILLAILAAGGIGFGVWAMMDGNAQKEQLQEQINALKAVNNQLQEKIDSSSKGEQSNTNSSTDTNGQASTNESDDASRYLYVGEWGLKIKKPETLEAVTYSYDYGDGYTMLKVTGVTKDSGQDLPDFASIANCYLGAVSRYSKQRVDMGGVPDYYPDPFLTDDEYNYYFVASQDSCTQVSDYVQREQDAWNALKEMLGTSDNYVKL